MAAEPPFDAILESISDGLPIDWESADRGIVDAGEKSRIGTLRELARIVAFNRGLQRTPRAGDPATAGEAGGGPVPWGDLTLLERIGTGSGGEVWRAWDATLQREVAVKFLDIAGGGEAERAPLLAEARALARVRHRGVVGVHGIDTHDGRTGLSMELLKGRTLAYTIERRGALPLREVVRVGLELAQALEAVDAAGLVHGDLKPANILLESDGRVVLADFGLGVRHDLGGTDREGGSGTPIFMAPELLAGGPATHGTDMYALGVTLWWALAGRAPFRSTSLRNHLEAAGRGPMVTLRAVAPDAPAELVRAIEKAMNPDPGQRFPSAGALAAALRSVPMERVEPEPPARVAATTPARTSRRMPFLAWGAAVLVAAAALIALTPRWLHRALPMAPGPAASPETAPLASAAGGAWSVEAALLGRDDGAERRLGADDRVRPGDNLSLEFRAERRSWVYVLNEDEQGETYLLFPQPLFDVTNPLPADTTLILPGTIGGRENAWTVTSRGGREHFLIVASTEPLEEIEAELAAMPKATPDRTVRYARIGPATLERLRGVGGVAPLPATPTPRRAGAFDRFEALAGRETVARPVWVRRITLRNP